MRQRSRPDRFERTAALLVVAVVGLPCVLLAGAHAPVQAALFALAAVAIALHVAGRVRRRRPLRVPVLAAPILVGGALTLLSLCPLPHALRAPLSPTSTARLDHLLPLLSEQAAALVLPVLAFDPPEAALALVRLSVALIVLIVIADQSRARSGRQLVWRGVLVIAFVTGFAVIFSTAVGIPRFFDVVGVPVNVNHRARVLGALGLLCLGRAWTLRPRVEAAWFGVGGALCALLVPVTQSRGGVFALVVGAAVLGLIASRRRAEDAPPRWHAVAGIAVALAAVAGGALLVAGETALAAMAEETLAHPERLKTFLWGPALRLAESEPLVGVGNNGFATAFPAVLRPGELDATLTYTHAENVVLQTFCDHGLVGGGLVLFSCLIAVSAVRHALRRPAELAAAPAVVFLVVGDIFDFALETLAGLGLCALSLGLLSGRLAAHRRPLVSLRPALSVVVVVVAVGLGGAAARLGVAQWRFQIDTDLSALRGDDRRPALERALAAHPSDATYATLLARDARRRQQPEEALRYANRALLVWPALAPAHLEVARALFALGAEQQAMLHYRRAWQAKVDSALVAEIARRTPDPALRRRALPTPVKAVDLARLCEVLVQERRIPEARACFVEAMTLADATAGHARRAIALALDAGDVEAARAFLPRLVPEGSIPDGEDARVAARVLAASAGAEAALSATASWFERARDPLPLLEWRLQALRESGRVDDAIVTLERMLPASRSLQQRHTFEVQLVELLQLRGEYARALETLNRTLARRPRDPTLLAHKALLEIELERSADAAATLDRLRAVAPGDRRIAEIERGLLSPEPGAPLPPGKVRRAVAP